MLVVNSTRRLPQTPTERLAGIVAVLRDHTAKDEHKNRASGVLPLENWSDALRMRSRFLAAAAAPGSPDAGSRSA